MKVDKIPRGQTDKRKAYMKQYTATHPKRDRRAYKKNYDEINREKNKRYRIEKGQELLVKKKDYYKANRDRILTKVKEYGIENKDKILAYQANYYRSNTQKVKDTVAAYRSANPEKKKHLENRRRARKFKNGGSHTVEELKEKFDRLGNVCFYCGASCSLTIDHDIPLSRGGTDDINNILPACRSCNSKKKTKTAKEFIEMKANRSIK